MRPCKPSSKSTPHPSWSFYHVRPWEPRRKRSYLAADLKKRPWHYVSPPHWQLWTWLFIFLVCSVVVPLIPLTLQLSTFSTLTKKVYWPDFTAPAWVWVYSWVVTQILSATAIWFIYLHNGIYAQFIRLLFWISVRILVPLSIDVFVSSFNAHPALWMAATVLLLACCSAALNFKVMKVTLLLQLPELVLFTYTFAVLIVATNINGTVLNQRKWENWRNTPYA